MARSACWPDWPSPIPPLRAPLPLPTREVVADFDALDAGLADSGYASIADYLAAKADGTATPEQVAALDPLVDAVGGTTEDGLALAETRPTEEDIAAAEAAALAAEQGVADAEAAIGAAWNKPGDLGALLAALREKLAADQDAIDAAILASQAGDDLAAAVPVDDTVSDGEALPLVE